MTRILSLKATLHKEASMALRVACPSCRSEVVVEQSLAGHDIFCPRCGERFTAPSITAAPPAGLPSTFEPLPTGEGEPRDRPERDRAERDLQSLPRFDSRDDLDLGPIRANLEGRWRT